MSNESSSLKKAYRDGEYHACGEPSKRARWLLPAEKEAFDRGFADQLQWVKEDELRRSKTRVLFCSECGAPKEAKG